MTKATAKPQNISLKPRIMVCFCLIGLMLAAVLDEIRFVRAAVARKDFPSLTINLLPNNLSEASQPDFLKAEISAEFPVLIYAFLKDDKGWSLFYPSIDSAKSPQKIDSITLELRSELSSDLRNGTRKLIIITCNPSVNLLSESNLNADGKLELPDKFEKHLHSLHESGQVQLIPLHLPDPFTAYLPPPPPPVPAPVTETTASESAAPSSKNDRQADDTTASTETSAKTVEQTFPHPSDYRADDFQNQASTESGNIKDLNPDLAATPAEKPADSAEPAQQNLSDEDIRKLKQYYEQGGGN